MFKYIFSTILLLVINVSAEEIKYECECKYAEVYVKDPIQNIEDTQEDANCEKFSEGNSKNIIFIINLNDEYIYDAEYKSLRSKLEKNLGSISEMTRLPGAIFVVDIKREYISIKEAQKLKIPIFAMVDTNSDPRDVDFVIPSNDDASKSIDKILSIISSSISEGLEERRNEKEEAAKAEKENINDNVKAKDNESTDK